MNGPDSISDPVAHRLCSTESYPSARGSARLGFKMARLNSARLAADDMAGGTHSDDVSDDWTLTCCWLYDDMACWLDAGVPDDWALTCMLTVYTGVMITSWWRHPYPGLARGSGQLVFGLGQPIRAKKTHGTRGARLRAWADALLESDGECGHVRCPILTPFSPVASSRPPLHSGMVKT
jgi:hypothetical protein